MPQGNNGANAAAAIAQARVASASTIGRFSGAEQFDVRTVDLNAPTSINYRTFNLNRPLESIVIGLRFRATVTVGAYADVAAEAPQNILQRIRLEGQHRTHGNLMIMNMSGASAFVYPQMSQWDAGSRVYTSVGGGALTAATRTGGSIVGQPFTSPFTGAVATHDMIVHYVIPVGPWIGGGNPAKRWANSFLLLPGDWNDSLMLTLDFGDESAFGDPTGATVAFTAFQSAAGLPEVSVHLNYSLLGALQGQGKQGIFLRTERLFNTFTSASTESIITNLDKRITTALYIKSGTIEDTGQSAGVRTFDSLDSLLLDRTQIIVDNKPVRNITDNLIERDRLCRQFSVPAIAGYHMLTFVDGQNPLLAYRGDGLPGGARFDLVSDVIGPGANTRISVMQEQIVGGPFPAMQP